MRSRGGGAGGLISSVEFAGRAARGLRLWVSEALPVEDDALGSFGEPLGDHLCVERVGKHLRPVLEDAVGSDAGRASMVVTLRDDLKGELGLGGVHREDREV